MPVSVTVLDVVFKKVVKYHFTQITEKSDRWKSYGNQLTSDKVNNTM